MFQGKPANCFDDSKIEKRLLERALPEESTLGDVPFESCVELSWWPILANTMRVGYGDGDSPVQVFDESSHRNLVIESQYAVSVGDPENCYPVEVRLKLSFEPYEKADATSPLRPPLIVVAAWPRPGPTPPISITRGIKTDGSLSVSYEDVYPSLWQISSHEEKFERFVPNGCDFVDAGVTPRSVLYAIRTGTTFSHIDGQHYCGVWVSYPSGCFVRVWADIETWVKTRGFGKYWRCRRLKPERFVVKDCFTM